MEQYTLSCPCGNRMEVREGQLGRICQCAYCGEPVLVDYRRVTPPIPRFSVSAPRHFAADEVPVHLRKGDEFMDLYEVVDEVGSGGMGVVHRIRHKGWGTDLAIKSLKAKRLPNQYCMERFEEECETWIHLDPHPNVVTCYYVRRLGGVPRIFMEYISGGALEDWMEQGRLYAQSREATLERILDFALQMAWGLSYAHDCNLVHQDVKPGNVLLTDDGEVKMSDFGLVRALEATGSGGNGIEHTPVLGTPPYSPPEQDHSEAVSPKCDVWGWAATVLEMLLGRLRWADWRALARVFDHYVTEGIREAPVPEPPMGLAALLRRCLSPRPEERLDSMSEVACSMQEVYASTVGRAYSREEPKPSSTSPDLLNNRAVSLLDLGKSKEAERLWQQALSLDPHHAKAEYNLRLHLWRSGKITDVILVRWLMELCDTYRKTWLPRYLLSTVLLERGDCRSALEILRKLKEPYARRHEVMLAFAQAKTREDDTRRLLLDFPAHTDPIRSVFIAPNGKRALSGSESGCVKLWDLEACECLTSFQAHVGAVHALSMSRDQDVILSGGEDNCVKLHAASTGNCLRILQGHSAAVRAVRLGDENQIAVSGSKDHTIRVWHTETGECLMVLKDHTAGVNAVDVSESGRYVLSGSRDATLKLWDLNTGECARTYIGHESRIHSVSLSADGYRALSGSRDATVKLWDVHSGTCLRTFHGHRTEAYSVCLSRDADYALSASRSGTLKLWDCGTGQCLRSLSGSAPIWLSRNGRFAISGDENGVLKVWVVACDKERLPAPFMMCRDRT